MSVMLLVSTILAFVVITCTLVKFMPEEILPFETLRQGVAGFFSRVSILVLPICSAFLRLLRLQDPYLTIVQCESVSLEGRTTNSPGYLWPEWA